MNPAAFVRRWAALLPEAEHATFLLELAALITHEQARERRRLVTDASYFRRSVDETMAELRRQTEVPAP